RMAAGIGAQPVEEAQAERAALAVLHGVGGGESAAHLLGCKLDPAGPVDEHAAAVAGIAQVILGETDRGIEPIDRGHERAPMRWRVMRRNGPGWALGARRARRAHSACSSAHSTQLSQMVLRLCWMRMMRPVQNWLATSSSEP